ncbi:MAG: hypothetical protein IKB51_04125 [Clostridia bacterium]|nr:hypothetical protein [Clostridia bacterium]
MDDVLSFIVGLVIIAFIGFCTYGCVLNYKENKKQNQSQELLAGAHKIMLNETIQHFKDFFRKFGVTLSPEDVAHIMTQYAMAAEKGSPESALYSFIPDEIPSQNKFINETTYQFNYLLSICSDEIIKQRILNEWNSTIDEFTPFAVCGIYETQKLTVKEEEQYLFRFNYELNAIIMLLTYCDELAEEATEDEENVFNEFSEALIQYANSAGYSMFN